MLNVSFANRRRFVCRPSAISASHFHCWHSVHCVLPNGTSEEHLFERLSRKVYNKKSEIEAFSLSRVFRSFVERRLLDEDV